MNRLTSVHDPHISPLNTIAYHDAVQRFFGSAKANGFERLYLMPGMGHCSEGEGSSAFDLLTPMMDWVEQGSAPEGIMTSTPIAGPRAIYEVRTNAAYGPKSRPRRDMGLPPGMPQLVQGSPRSRPVYPYPYVATWSGKGDVDAAANWTKGQAVPVSVDGWAGSDYYAPYAGVTG